MRIGCCRVSYSRVVSTTSRGITKMPNYIHADPKRKLTENTLKYFMASNADPWVKTLFIYLYYYGVRISEALAVKVEDFEVTEYQGRSFLVVVSLTLKNQTDKSRRLWVPMGEPYINELLGYIKYKDTGRLWTYTRQWSRIKLQEILPWFTPHGARYNRMDDMAMGGISAFKLKSWAGWSSVKMADVYVSAASTRDTGAEFWQKKDG